MKGARYLFVYRRICEKRRYGGYTIRVAKTLGGAAILNHPQPRQKPVSSKCPSRVRKVIGKKGNGSRSINW